jgi:UrcA family protein
MMKTMMAVAATALVSFGTPLFAQDSLDAAQVKVRYDKADLTTSSGQRDIERKISFAVDRVCGDQVLGTKEEVDMIRDCKQSARSMARAQLPMTVAQQDR